MKRLCVLLLLLAGWVGLIALLGWRYGVDLAERLSWRRLLLVAYVVALAWLLAARQQILDVVELEQAGPSSPAVAVRQQLVAEAVEHRGVDVARAIDRHAAAFAR